MRFRILLFISLLICFIPQFALGASSVKISLDAYNPNKIEVGETFHITIEAVNNTGKLDVTQMPPGVKVVYHTTRQSSSRTVQNGKTEVTNSTSLIMTCKGETQGKFTFGPVSVDGTKSNAISYQIVAPTGQSKQNSGSSNANSQAKPGYDPNAGPVFVGKGNEEMFLKASVNKTSAYEQEAIEYVVKLYTTYGDIKFLGATAAPKFEGFVIEESNDVSKSFSFEEFKGKTYKTAIIARYIIFPQKSGKLKIIGNTYTVSTDAQQYYHDPYFQTLTVKYPVQLNVTPNEVEIDAKALPLPIPDNFIGGVGKFTLSSEMPDKELTTNSPASLIYTIQGIGNIKYLKMPDLGRMFPSSFEVYTPDIKNEIKVGTSNVSGTSRFDYSIVPKEAGSFMIPAIDLTYFDPEDGKYKTLSTREFNVRVDMGQQSSRSQQALSFNPGLMEAGRISDKLGTPYVNTWQYWLWYVIPIILFIVILSLYRKYLKDHEDIILLKSKQANKMALKRLAKAYQCIKNKQEEQFYNEMLAALWGYIGDKLKMPVSALNRNNVSEEFKSHGVKESTFMPIINLIDECEYAKYTPVSRNANMRQLYLDALQSLEKVESEYEESSSNGSSSNNNDMQETKEPTVQIYTNTSKINTDSKSEMSNPSDSNSNDRSQNTK